MKLRGKYTVVFLLLAVIPIARVSWISYINAESQLKDSIRNQARIAAKEYTIGIGNWLEGKENTLQLMAAILQKNPPPAKIKDYLQAYSSDSDISDMYFADGSGNSFIDGSGWQPPPSFHPDDRPWYKNAYDKNSVSFSGPYIDAITGRYICSISVPIHAANGSLLGILGEDISMDTLTRRAAEMQLDKHGYGCIIDKSGLIIAHPDKEVVGKNAYKLEGFTKPVQDFFSQEFGSSSYMLDNHNYFISWQHIPNTNWVFGLAVEETVLFKPLESMRSRFVIIACWMMAMAVLLSMIYAKKLTSPIARLMISAEQIAGGDLTVRTAMKGKDEIANFSRVFNKMTESLDEMIQGINKLAAEVDESAKTVAVFCEEAEQMVIQLNASINNSAQEASQQSISVQRVRDMLAGIIAGIGQISPELQDASSITVEEKEAAEQGIPDIQSQAALLGNNKKTYQAILDIASRIKIILTGLDLKNCQTETPDRESTTASIHQLNLLCNRILEEIEQANITIAQQEEGLVGLLETYSLLLEHTMKTYSFTESAMVDYKALAERANAGMEALNEIALVVMNNAVEAEDLATSTQQQAASISDISKHALRLSQNAQKMFEAVKKFRI